MSATHTHTLIPSLLDLSANTPTQHLTPALATHPYTLRPHPAHPTPHTPHPTPHTPHARPAPHPSQLPWSGAPPMRVATVAPSDRSVLVGANADALLLLRGATEAAADIVLAAGAELVVRPARLEQDGGPFSHSGVCRDRGLGYLSRCEVWGVVASHTHHSSDGRCGVRKVPTVGGMSGCDESVKVRMVARVVGGSKVARVFREVDRSTVGGNLRRDGMSLASSMLASSAQTFRR
eukprot:188928-Chlamydomonas_euryale.AAC.2